jgi:micrococcal nuclease
MTRRLLLALACTAVAACGAGGGTAAAPGQADVVRVVDGDTIVVRIAGQAADERVRLIGIDTPEAVDPRTPVMCFGAEASARARELVPEGTRVQLVRDVEPRDRYNRLLAYVYRADDGLFVNLVMVEEGFAAVSTYPPNVAHTEAFTAAAAAARAEGRGLWGACGGHDVPVEDG